MHSHKDLHQRILLVICVTFCDFPFSFIPIHHSWKHLILANDRFRLLQCSSHRWKKSLYEYLMRKNMHTSTYGMLLSLSFNNGAVCFFISLFYCITKFYFCWSADIVSTFWSLESNHHLCNYLVSGKFLRKGAEIVQDVTC